MVYETLLKRLQAKAVKGVPSSFRGLFTWKFISMQFRNFNRIISKCMPSSTYIISCLLNGKMLLCYWNQQHMLFWILIQVPIDFATPFICGLCRVTKSLKDDKCNWNKIIEYCQKRHPWKHPQTKRFTPPQNAPYVNFVAKNPFPVATSAKLSSTNILGFTIV